MKAGYKIMLILLVMVLAGSVYGWYLYHKKPADTRTAKSELQITAVDLVAGYLRDESEANRLYLEKVVEVKGTVREVQVPDPATVSVLLDGGDPMAMVTCSFYKTEEAAVLKLKPGDLITVKGICAGKLMDVVLNKCSLVK